MEWSKFNYNSYKKDLQIITDEKSVNLKKFSFFSCEEISVCNYTKIKNQFLNVIKESIFLQMLATGTRMLKSN